MLLHYVLGANSMASFSGPRTVFLAMAGDGTVGLEEVAKDIVRQACPEPIPARAEMHAIVAVAGAYSWK